jgi:hypothetical protein
MALESGRNDAARTPRKETGRLPLLCWVLIGFAIYGAVRLVRG